MAFPESDQVAGDIEESCHTEVDATQSLSEIWMTVPVSY